MYGFFNTRLWTKDYGLMTRKGFTLIELLVVVAIIGILSTVVFATIGGTRGRARDAKRLAEVKEIQLALAVEDTSSFSSQAMVGCASQNTKVSSCTAPVDLTAFSDPSYSANSACGSITTACDYGISNSAGNGGATTGDFRICFWLEDPPSIGVTGSAGVYKTGSGPSVSTSKVSANCDTNY